MIGKRLSTLSSIIAIVAIGLLALSETDQLLSVSVGSLDVNQQEVRVKMRDGIHLAADLYLPDAQGPFPTLVRKSPYTRERRPTQLSFLRLTAMPF